MIALLADPLVWVLLGLATAPRALVRALRSPKATPLDVLLGRIPWPGSRKTPPRAHGGAGDPRTAPSEAHETGARRTSLLDALTAPLCLRHATGQHTAQLGLVFDPNAGRLRHTETGPMEIPAQYLETRWDATATFPVYRAIGAVAVLAAVLIPAARPVHVIGAGHGCSYTSPEYALTDNNMDVTLKPGTTSFTARWTPGHRPWEDAYWYAGWHDSPSSICDSRELPGSGGLYGQSLTLGMRVSRHILVTASMRARGTGRLGLDLWFTASRTETSPAAMERDPRTREIMVMPGHGRIYRDNPGWHRVYMAILPERHGVVSFRGLNLTRIAAAAGVPGYLYWMQACGGAETTRGAFTVDWFALRIAGEHPVVSARWRGPAGGIVVARSTS